MIEKEIASLLTDDVSVRCGTRFGRDVTLDSLIVEGYKAVFLAIGAHESRSLGLDDENIEGVLPAMQFLKAFNLRGKELALGDVGIVGGGNSAIDAARVAIRQKDVKSVTLFYRRTEREMPAYDEEIEAAREEGVEIETLVSPENFSPRTDGGRNRMYPQPARRTGRPRRQRPRPVPQPGTEFAVNLDTLIVAIGEKPAGEILAKTGLELNKNGSIKTDIKTFQTSREGVFAGGDVATGPATVVDAIATGKRAAEAIDLWLRGETPSLQTELKIPRTYIEPATVDEEWRDSARRVKSQSIAIGSRVKNIAEVERTISKEEAVAEARRCLRCDLRFTCDADGKPLESIAINEKST